MFAHSCVINYVITLSRRWTPGFTRSAHSALAAPPIDVHHPSMGRAGRGSEQRRLAAGPGPAEQVRGELRLRLRHRSAAVSARDGGCTVIDVSQHSSPIGAAKRSTHISCRTRWRLGRRRRSPRREGEREVRRRRVTVTRPSGWPGPAERPAGRPPGPHHSVECAGTSKSGSRGFLILSPFFLPGACKKHFSCRPVALRRPPRLTSAPGP